MGGGRGGKWEKGRAKHVRHIFVLDVINFFGMFNVCPITTLVGPCAIGASILRVHVFP